MVAEVIINKAVKSLNKLFDYNIPADLEDEIEIGSRVVVPFGNGEKLEEAFIVNIKEKSDFKIKDIVQAIKGFSLSKQNIDLSLYMSRRYFANMSDCIKLMLPPEKLNKKFESRKTKAKDPFENKLVEKTTNLLLTEQQQNAYDKISRSVDSGEFKKFLLHGVTGSRKNRSVFATNTKSARKGKNSNRISARNFAYPANGR